MAMWLSISVYVLEKILKKFICLCSFSLCRCKIRTEIETLSAFFGILFRLIRFNGLVCL